jgi:hypothetical protein
MLLLRLFLRGFAAQLLFGCCVGKETHLRQVHVVSVGEGNVDCDDIHNAGCGDELHPESGVLLLPEGKDGKMKAFNVHTMMLPQHGSSVNDQIDLTVNEESAVIHAVDEQSKLAEEQIYNIEQEQKTELLQLATKASATGTLLLLCMVACLAFVFVQAFSSSMDDGPTPRDKDWFEPEEVVGSWRQAYKNARGSRRVALDMLFKSSIIPNQEMCRTDVTKIHIEECIQIAEQMLQERSEKEWVDSWQQAQRIFEQRRTAGYKEQVHHMMAAYEFSDGSWARAYRQSEGQDRRREGFELLLRLDIISSDEFANSPVPPKLIEERLAVALDLLSQKSLKEWVDLCESAHGKNFKESVMQCFSVQPGPTPRDPDEWNLVEATGIRTPPHARQGQPKLPPIPISTQVYQSPEDREFRAPYDMPESEDSLASGRLNAADPLRDTLGSGTLGSIGRNSPDLLRDSSQLPTYQRAQVKPPTSAPLGFQSSNLSPRGTANRGPAMGSASAMGRPVHVLPVSGSTPPTAMTEPSLNPTMLPPTSMAKSPRHGGTDWRGVPLGSTPKGSMRNSAMRQSSGNSAQLGSQAFPAQIMFSNNAISGSSWEASVTPPRTPPRTPPASERVP